MPSSEYRTSTKNLSKTKILFETVRPEFNINKIAIEQKKIISFFAPNEINIKKVIPYSKKTFLSPTSSAGSNEVFIKNILDVSVFRKPYCMRGKFATANAFFFWYASIIDTEATESGYPKSSFSQIALTNVLLK